MCGLGNRRNKANLKWKRTIKVFIGSIVGPIWPVRLYTVSLLIRRGYSETVRHLTFRTMILLLRSFLLLNYSYEESW